jgi:hypothetical protein
LGLLFRLFAIAQTEIDSSVTSILNFDAAKHLGFGCISFGVGFERRQVWGVLIDFGAYFLVLMAMNHPNQNYYYAILVIIASIML